MNEQLKELQSIIYKMDALLEYWFDGYDANAMAADGDDVYAQADECRNRALKIIKNLQENA